MVEIVFVDTWMRMGFFDPKHNRIEVSKYLRQFPELYQFVIEHEIQHSLTFEEYGYSARLYWEELKDRFLLCSNEKFFSQYMKFKRETEPKFREMPFYLGYTLINMVTSFFGLIPSYFVFRHLIKKLRK